jgi:hypothetical protein
MRSATLELQNVREATSVSRTRLVAICEPCGGYSFIPCRSSTGASEGSLFDKLVANNSTRNCSLLEAQSYARLEFAPSTFRHRKRRLGKLWHAHKPCASLAHALCTRCRQVCVLNTSSHAHVQVEREHDVSIPRTGCAKEGCSVYTTLLRMCPRFSPFGPLTNTTHS